ncbi:MAG TPA: TMEM175 family protein [Candidatus Sulfotelmatobacter sp.]|nr:TMEM175 family protein [Candidatus Sulfotelmatobacter sp.]
MNKGRLEAFSDGVFAVSITLLVLDVHLPPGAQVTPAALRALLPRVAAFILSFVIVGVYWVAHHHMLHFVRQVDRTLLWLNLLVLLCVVFIPFPASLLGTQLTSSLAVRLYALTLVATNSAGSLFWMYAASQRELIDPQVTPQFARFVVRLHSSPILVYGTAVAVASWSVPASLVLCAAVPLFFILPNPFLSNRIGTQIDTSTAE